MYKAGSVKRKWLKPGPKYGGRSLSKTEPEILHEQYKGHKNEHLTK